MNFAEAIRTCLRKYETFEGRAQREEFWYWILFRYTVLLIAVIIGITSFGTESGIDSDAGVNLSLFGPSLLFVVAFGPLSFIVAIVSWLPSLSVFVRRLHDHNKSGWWYWLGLIPIVGPIVLLVWMCTRGNSVDNRFGPAPSPRVR